MGTRCSSDDSVMRGRHREWRTLLLIVLCTIPGAAGMFVLLRYESAPGADSPGPSLAASDPAGVEAKRFGATTSGHVSNFAPNRYRLYSGGITRSRGHSGGSVGRESILALTRGKQPEAIMFPVFGCPLFEHARGS